MHDYHQNVSLIANRLEIQAEEAEAAAKLQLADVLMILSKMTFWLEIEVAAVRSTSPLCFFLAKIMGNIA
jgi:hypothetical protein